MPDSPKTCFVISPIGEAGTQTRERADLVFDFVIGEALEPLGYQVERADKLGEPGIITNQIIDRVTSSDLVIADLSERNPNVFYELAIRHATRKPYVHLIAHDEDIPFDNAAVRAIKIDVRDLRSVKAAKDELVRQVEAAMAPEARIESPVSIALSIQEMRTSGDEEKLALSALSTELSQIRRGFNDLTSLVSAAVAARPEPSARRALGAEVGLTPDQRRDWTDAEKVQLLTRYLQDGMNAWQRSPGTPALDQVADSLAQTPAASFAASRKKKP